MHHHLRGEGGQAIAASYDLADGGDIAWPPLTLSVALELVHRGDLRFEDAEGVGPVRRRHACDERWRPRRGEVGIGARPSGPGDSRRPMCRCPLASLPAMLLLLLLFLVCLLSIGWSAARRTLRRRRWAAEDAKAVEKEVRFRASRTEWSAGSPSVS